jgi:hypothetical protein
MYLRKLFLLAMSCSMAGVMFAQEVPKVIPPSPVAAAIQRYGDYPVSSHTGIPDIKIPIYTIEAGDIKIPIYLSYHGAGTQLSDLEGTTNYVGLGWTLQTGGVISRNINGLPDEEAQEINHEGWGLNYTSSYYDMHHVEEGFVDHEYDIYSYNFLGRSGKFIANPDWKPNQTEWKPFLFSNDGLRFNASSGSFSINDEEGKGYSFGGDDAIEYADYTTYNSMTKSARSAWYLKGIGSAKYPGTQVLYYYQPGPTMWKDSKSTTWILDSWINSELDDVSYPYSYSLNNNLVNNSSRIYYRTYLPYSINFPSGKISFTLDASKMLNKIEVFDKQNNLIKTVSLQIGSFNGLAPKLMSVTFKDATGKQQETYSFNYYNEEDQSPVPWGKDHWGFLNGAPYNNGDYIMPFSLANVSQGFYYKININRAGANREPNEYFARMFTLRRITYPTKGYTEFEFEGNITDDYVPVGGLRIKSFSSYFQDGQLASQKNYTYKSSGGLEVIPSIDVYRKSTTFMMNNIWESHRRHFSDVALLDLAPKGSPLVYTNVTEKEGELTTIYMYEDAPAYEYDYMNFPGHYSGENGEFKYKKFAHYFRPWNFGNLSFKRTFGPGFDNLESYAYDEYLTDTTHDLLFERVVDASCLGTGGSNSCSNYHEIQVHTGLYSSLYNYSKRYFLSGGKRLTNKSTTSWTSDGGQITTGTNYYYDNPAYPTMVTRQTTTNSKGEEVLSELKHATDFPAQVPYTTMVEQYRIAPVVKQINSIVKPGGNQLLSGTTTNYINWGNNLIAPGTIDVEKNGDTYTAVRFSQYDVTGNITEMSKENNPKLSFLWDYNATLPVAECTNATAGQIAYTSFETEEKGNWVFNGTAVSEAGAPTGNKAYLLNGSNGISRSVPAGLGDYIISYWTTNTNAFSIPGTKTNYPVQGNQVGNWKYFEHRIAGQTQVVIDGSGLIDELRFYPATAQMTTYTYAPLIGMTSACDIKNAIKYYEYDAAGRLSLVRDQDKNVLQKICYNYAGQQIDCGGTIFYSKAKCQQFTKSCSVDYYADTYDYCVPADKYSSTQSQAAADALADADIAANGQITANQKAECHKKYFNAERTEVYRRTDCLGGVPGSPVPLTIPARATWSLVDQKDADDLALQWLNTWGPIRAIENGTCLTYGNREIDEVFYSQLCDLAGGERPNAYPVHIAENSIISTVSQQDADTRAYNQAAQAANDNGGCYLYYTVPLLLTNSTGYYNFTFELVKEDDPSATFFFDADGESYGLLGYVAEGEYTVNFYSDYYSIPFSFMVGCETPASDTRGIILYHQTINSSCNILEIF